MTYLDIREIKNRTVLLSLIRKDNSEGAYDLYRKRYADLSNFLGRVVSKEIRSQGNGR
jgi:hypothetical protein